MPKFQSQDLGIICLFDEVLKIDSGVSGNTKDGRRVLQYIDME